MPIPIPRELFERGFNQRGLTYEDFEEICAAKEIDVMRHKMKPPGAYFTLQPFPDSKFYHYINLCPRLSGNELVFNAFHELTHYFYDTVEPNKYPRKPSLRFLSRSRTRKREWRANTLGIIALIPFAEYNEIINHGLLHNFSSRQLKLRGLVLSVTGM